MVQTRVSAYRRSIAVALISTAMLLVGFGQGSAQADVTAVSGGAYGYFSRITLFQPPPIDRGPAPTVTLPAGGSAAPITATAPTGSAQYGPAFIFSSGPITVSTQGTTGPTGSVTTSTNIQNVNTSGQEVFTASNVSSTCTASEAGATGSAAITGGTLQTSEGDPNVDGDETVVTVPANPAPNTTFNGTVAGDNFQYIFNEQILNPDGSITVNAGHQKLLGPTATGDLFFGQSRCGVTVADLTPPQTTIDSGPTGTINTNSASFTFSSSETGSTFECKLDGPGATTGTFGSCTSPKTYSTLADGTYTFSVRATDAANNTDQTPATRDFTVATSPPPGHHPPPEHHPPVHNPPPVHTPHIRSAATKAAAKKAATKKAKRVCAKAKRARGTKAHAKASRACKKARRAARR